MCKKKMLGIVLALALVSAGGARADIATGLIGYWPLDGDGVDISGNGFNGTIVGKVVPTTDRTGAGDAAMAFDGAAGSYIDLANRPEFQLTGEMTLAAWVFLNAGNTNNCRIISKAGGGGARSWSLNIENDSGGVRYPATFQIAVNGNTNLSVLDKQPLPTDEWVHMAGVYRPGQATEVYVNGELRATNTTNIPATQHSSNGLPVLIGSRAACNNCGWNGAIDEVCMYGRALSPSDIRELALGQPGLATDPQPANGAADVPADTSLSWAAGKYALTHDVYLGTAFADVNAASVANPLDVLVGQGQTDTTFAPSSLLYGQTYFWRVDEVNAPPESTVFKGNMWSFTVEPYAYPIQNVTATAASFQAGMGPENAVNGSGLNADDQHAVEGTQMWLSNGDQPNWIQFEFDQAYKLDELWVWNSNQLVEAFVGFGAKDVTIEYSVDGENWTALEGVPEFARATGQPTYTANTTVEFGGVVAQYVKLTIDSGWGALPQAGLAEVRFFYVPVQAREPQPAVDATGVALDATLSWRAGREAASHQVYFGTDQDAVTAGTAPAESTDVRSFSPTAMEYGRTYYWRVDEVNEAATPALYEGPVWSFTTQEYAVVEDFESYNDDDNRIYQAWVDGVTDGKSGSTVGYFEAPFAERTIIHGGTQSMPLEYDNTTMAFSEATFTFDGSQNWTASGIKSLSLYFQGQPDNTGKLYLKINNTKVPYSGDAADIAKAAWQPWNIDLSTVGGSLSNVTKLVIGIEGSGATGLLYIDDIRLYPKAPEFITPTDPGTAGLLALYSFEGNANDGSANKLNGTIKDGQLVASGRPNGGSALSVSKAGYADLGNPPLLDFNTGDWSVAAWYKTAITGTGDANKGTLYGKGGDTAGGHRYCLIMSETTEGVLTLVTDDDVTKYVVDSTSKTNDDEWHFVVGQREGTALRLYIDGVLEGTGTATETYNLAGTKQHNAYIGAITDHTNNVLYKLYNGLIDDVRIFNRALSEAEILWLAGRTTPMGKPF